MKKAAINTKYPNGDVIVFNFLFKLTLVIFQRSLADVGGFHLKSLPCRSLG